jgi:hypothetical protein
MCVCVCVCVCVFLQEASEVRAEELAATARELHQAYAQMEVVK